MGPRAGKMTMPRLVSTSSLFLEPAFLLRVALALAWIIVAMRVYLVCGDN